MKNWDGISNSVNSIQTNFATSISNLETQIKTTETNIKNLKTNKL
jgi:hypothetical protein